MSRENILRLILAPGLALAWCFSGLAVAAEAPDDKPAAVVVPELRIAAVGDIMLGGTATQELQKFGYDYPYAKTRDVLKQAQIVFGNLEGPLTTGGKAGVNKQYIFRSPPDKVAPALARAGFNVVSLANNHTLDYGPEGLDDTRAALDKAGIQSVGAGKNEAEARQAVLIKVGEATVAFLGYSLTFPEEFWAGKDKPGTAFGHERFLRADVAAARKKADIVIVSFHWGQEGKTDLRDYQIQMGHAAVDAGAAAVLGSHPHVLQAVEHYKEGVILYSLGNFTFGSYSKDAMRSAIALLTFQGKQLHDVKLVPININNFEVVFQPYPLTGRAAEEVIEQLQQMSQVRGTPLEKREDAAELVLTKPGT